MAAVLGSTLLFPVCVSLPFHVISSLTRCVFSFFTSVVYPALSLRPCFPTLTLWFSSTTVRSDKYIVYCFDRIRCFSPELAMLVTQTCFVPIHNPYSLVINTACRYQLAERFVSQTNNWASHRTLVTVIKCWRARVEFSSLTRWWQSPRFSPAERLDSRRHG